MGKQQQMQRKAPVRRDLPDTLTAIPPEQFPIQKIMPIKAWFSKRYLVQLFSENSDLSYGIMYRMSVNRAEQTRHGKWRDGLTWDELQKIKHDIGFGDWFGVEVYPWDEDVINVSNMRHIWLLKMPLPWIGWVK